MSEKKVAVIDLGSNSFRLLIGVLEGDVFVQQAYLKETVRQGQLDEHGAITPEGLQRGYDCLKRFKERLGHDAYDVLKAVATHTLREASNRQEFLQQAQAILGFPIEVISGGEEARLIFSGVTHLLPESPLFRTAIDIGGRSSEVVSGSGVEALTMRSYPIGSVSAMQRYFNQPTFTEQQYQHALTSVIAGFDHAEKLFSEYMKQPEVWGCSGTVNAVYELMTTLAEQGEAFDTHHNGYPCIHRLSMAKLRNLFIEKGQSTINYLPGIKTDREPIFLGGFLVLDALFELFGLEHLFLSEGALRHGLIYDATERQQHYVQRRERTIAWLLNRWNHDAGQGRLVAQVARELLLQCYPHATVSECAMLEWVALVHDIGMVVSSSSLNKHGAYLLQHTELIGFSETEQQTLVQFVLASKGKLKAHAQWLSQSSHALLALSLRLAIALCHARRMPDMSAVRMSMQEQVCVVLLRMDWSQQHPQSMYLLQEEVAIWQKIGFTLQLNIA